MITCLTLSTFLCRINSLVMEEVLNGFVHVRPPHCPEAFYNTILLPCFCMDAKDRPTFSQTVADMVDLRPLLLAELGEEDNNNVEILEEVDFDTIGYDGTVDTTDDYSKMFMSRNRPKLVELESSKPTPNNKYQGDAWNEVTKVVEMAAVPSELEQQNQAVTIVVCDNFVSQIHRRAYCANCFSLRTEHTGEDEDAPELDDEGDTYASFHAKREALVIEWNHGALNESGAEARLRGATELGERLFLIREIDDHTVGFSVFYDGTNKHDVLELGDDSMWRQRGEDNSLGKSLKFAVARLLKKYNYRSARPLPCSRQQRARRWSNVLQAANRWGGATMEKASPLSVIIDAGDDIAMSDENQTKQHGSAREDSTEPHVMNYHTTEGADDDSDDEGDYSSMAHTSNPNTMWTVEPGTNFHNTEGADDVEGDDSDYDHVASQPSNSDGGNGYYRVAAADNGEQEYLPPLPSPPPVPHRVSVRIGGVDKIVQDVESPDLSASIASSSIAEDSAGYVQFRESLPQDVDTETGFMESEPGTYEHTESDRTHRNPDGYLEVDDNEVVWSSSSESDQVGSHCK